jgi:hypothetical protein
VGQARLSPADYSRQVGFRTAVPFQDCFALARSFPATSIGTVTPPPVARHFRSGPRVLRRAESNRRTVAFLPRQRPSLIFPLQNATPEVFAAALRASAVFLLACDFALWGRLLTCGGLVTRLPVRSRAGRVDARLDRSATSPPAGHRLFNPAPPEAGLTSVFLLNVGHARSQTSRVLRKCLVNRSS